MNVNANFNLHQAPDRAPRTTRDPEDTDPHSITNFLFSDTWLLEQKILTCGSKPPHPDPLVESYVDAIRTLYVHYLCKRWQELRKTAEERFVYEVSTLTQAYHPHFGIEAIKPFRCLTRYLDNWAKWVKEKKGKHARPPVSGKKGIMFVCGVDFGKNAFMEAIASLKEEIGWKYVRKEEKRKMAEIEGYVMEMCKDRFREEFETVEEMLGLEKQPWPIVEPLSSPLVPNEGPGAQVDDPKAVEEDSARVDQDVVSSAEVPPEVIDLESPSDGGAGEMDSGGADVVMRDLPVKYSPPSGSGPNEADGSVDTSALEATADRIDPLIQEARFGNPSRFTNSHKNTGLDRYGVQLWLAGTSDTANSDTV